MRDDVRAEALGDLALAAATAGADAIGAVRRSGDLDVASKARPGDLVTRADTAAEAAIIERLLGRRPDDAVLAEESGARAGTSGVRWVIDPLDGTMNFVHGRRDWAVAVAAEVDGALAAGAVCRPAYGDWFAAGGGQARSSSGTPRVDQARRLDEALVSVAVPVWLERRDRALGLLGAMLPHVRDFRRVGSAAVELTDLATGALDAFVGLATKPWDLLPGLAVALGAGARCTRLPTAAGELAVIATPTVAEDLLPLIEELIPVVEDLAPGRGAAP